MVMRVGSRERAVICCVVINNTSVGNSVVRSVNSSVVNRAVNNSVVHAGVNNCCVV